MRYTRVCGAEDAQVWVLAGHCREGGGAWRGGGCGREGTTGSHLVVEVAVEAQDVGVAQMRLDLDLAPELVLDVALLQLVLEEHLERHDELAVLLPGKVDVAKLAAPQGAPDIEVAQGPAPLLALCFHTGWGR